MTKLFVARPIHYFAEPQHEAAMRMLTVECLRRDIPLYEAPKLGDSLPQRVRNNLVHKFLRTDCTHLLFVDADIMFDPDDVFRMLGLGLDVVGGVYRKKVEADPHEMDSYVLNLLPGDMRVEHGILEVQDLGTGFMLIKREVFEKMAAAHPEWSYAGPDGPRVAFFDTYIDPSTREYLSEDWVFCRRWRAMGGKVHCLASCTLVHIGTHGFKGNVANALFPVDFAMPDHASSGVRAEYYETRQGAYDIPGVDGIRSVLDVGANVGAFALWAHERWPHAKVTCVEPVAEMLGFLQQNAPFAEVIAKAAVDTEALTIPMREGANIGCTSVFKNPDSREHSFDAPVIRPSALPPAEFLKLDTEGCEMEILASYDLSKTRAVALEYHRGDERPISRLLERAGFEVVDRKRYNDQLGILKARRP